MLSRSRSFAGGQHDSAALRGERSLHGRMLCANQRAAASRHVYRNCHEDARIKIEGSRKSAKRASRFGNGRALHFGKSASGIETVNIRGGKAASSSIGQGNSGGNKATPSVLS